MFEKLKTFYNKGLYNKTQLYNFVNRKVITEEQYIEIVGEESEVE